MADFGHNSYRNFRYTSMMIVFLFPRVVVPLELHDANAVDCSIFVSYTRTQANTLY